MRVSTKINMASGNADFLPCFYTTLQLSWPGKEWMPHTSFREISAWLLCLRISSYLREAFEVLKLSYFLIENNSFLREDPRVANDIK